MTYVKKKHQKSASEDALFYSEWSMVHIAELANSQS